MGKPIRVLEIISGFAIEGPLGGIERFAIELTQALPADIEPIVCGMWDYHTPSDQEWLSYLREKKIEAFVAAPWQDIAPYVSFYHCLRGIRKVLVNQHVDVIHSHCQFGDALALLMKKELKAKRVIRTVHNEREWPRRLLRRLLFTHFWALLRFDIELGVSKKVVSNLNKRPVARFLQKEAQLCYNSLNLSRFTTSPNQSILQAYQSKLGLPTDAIVIGSVGRLETQKGYTYLLDAMPMVVAHFPQAHLVIAGDGTLAADLQAQANASPVASHIHLLGSQRHIERFYALLDLFVSSSLWEGLPTVLLESIAANVPIVATAVSGSVELIKDGMTGRLVSANDGEALANGIMTALADYAASVMMAQAARPILQQFDIQQTAKFHNELYHSVLS